MTLIAIMKYECCFAIAPA